MSPLRGLLVEDNELQSQLVTFLLHDAGYLTQTAASAEEALETLHSFQPEFILMDLQLPGMDGLELTRRLRFDPKYTNTVIVALTAYTEQSDLEAAREAGCNAHICKPIDTSTFASLVRKIVQGAGSDVTADSRDLLTEMRNTFLAEGLAQVSAILRALDTGPGCALDAIQRVVHRWIGLGENLGFGDIADHARTMIEPGRDSSDIGQQVERDIAAAKSLFLDAVHSERKLPSGLVSGLLDLRIGLAGFGACEVERMQRLAKRSNAQVSLEPVEGRWISRQNEFNAFVILDCSSSGAALRLISELRKPALFIASRSALCPLVTLAASNCDFLIAPWDAEEVFLRLYRLVTSPLIPRQRAENVPPVSPRILVVDDDPSILALVSHALRELDMKCDGALSGEQAIDTVRRTPPDALILDVNLEDLDGFEVLKRLRRNLVTKDLPILLLTGRQKQSDVRRGFDCGADDYVIKPFKPFELAGRVKRMIAARAKFFKPRD